MIKGQARSVFCCMFIALMLGAAAQAQKRYSSWDQFRYAGPGLTQIGQLATKHSSQIAASPWSVGCETLDRDYADFSVYKEYVGRLGVKHARLQSGWAKCEKEKGVYDFQWLDEIVYGLVEQSVTPWMCLCYGNPIYGSDYQLKAKLFTDDVTLSAWLNYVEATVRRYKDVITEWEVWNEPNNGNEGFEEYTLLLMKTADVIRKIQPEAVIIGLSMYRIDLEFADGVLGLLEEHQQLGMLDYVCYHPYTNNPDDSYEDVRALKKLVNAYSPDLKLYQGENGCPSILEWGHALKYYPWTEISQAKWLMRRMAGDRAHDIRTSVFTMVDLKYPNMLQSFGLLRTNLLHQVIYKRPSYYGVQHMVSFFDDTVKPAGLLEHRTNAYRAITVAGFEKNDSPVLLLWYNDRIPDDTLAWDPVDVTVIDVHFEDPVYVEMVSGKVYAIDAADWHNRRGEVRFVNLPVWDSVVMIAEKSQVQLRTE